MRWGIGGRLGAGIGRLACRCPQQPQIVREGLHRSGSRIHRPCMASHHNRPTAVSLFHLTRALSGQAQVSGDDGKGSVNTRRSPSRVPGRSSQPDETSTQRSVTTFPPRVSRYAGLASNSCRRNDLGVLATAAVAGPGGVRVGT
jgi:hypothetical protein